MGDDFDEAAVGGGRAAMLEGVHVAPGSAGAAAATTSWHGDSVDEGLGSIMGQTSALRAYAAQPPWPIGLLLAGKLDGPSPPVTAATRASAEGDRGGPGQGDGPDTLDRLTSRRAKPLHPHLGNPDTSLLS